MSSLQMCFGQRKLPPTEAFLLEIIIELEKRIMTELSGLAGELRGVRAQIANLQASSANVRADVERLLARVEVLIGKLANVPLPDDAQAELNGLKDDAAAAAQTLATIDAQVPEDQPAGDPPTSTEPTGSGESTEPTPPAGDSSTEAGGAASA